MIVFKDSTLSNAVGLKPDEILARISFSLQVNTYHLQFHRPALP